MLTNEDIKKIVEASKEAFYDKKELDVKFAQFYNKKEMDDKFYDKKELDAKFSEVDDSFTKMFVEMDKRFKNIEDRLDEMKQDYSNLQSSVDAYAKKADAYFQEMVVLTHRVDRLESWAQKISNKLGIQLEF